MTACARLWPNVQPVCCSMHLHLYSSCERFELQHQLHTIQIHISNLTPVWCSGSNSLAAAYTALSPPSWCIWHVYMACGIIAACVSSCCALLASNEAHVHDRGLILSQCLVALVPRTQRMPEHRDVLCSSAAVSLWIQLVSHTVANAVPIVSMWFILLSWSSVLVNRPH